jgi:DNA-binding response OmpR family regulator
MGSVRGRRVLVCEDDPAMIRIFQFLLRQQGVVGVSTTSRGESVSNLAVQEKPDLILLDLMLPGKDGLTVLNELKSNPTTQAIPVIVVSGRESQEQVRQAMTAGAIDYIIKPFEPMELGMRIRNFLESLAPTADRGGPYGGGPTAGSAY